MENHDWKNRMKKSKKKLATWTTIWTMSTALATFGPKFIWDNNTAITVIAILLNVTMGVGMILANIKFLSTLDDLQKKIQLEGMAIALGVGIVGGLSYSLLDITNVISVDAEISFLVILIGLTYLVSILIGQNKYS